MSAAGEEEGEDGLLDPGLPSAIPRAERESRARRSCWWSGIWMGSSLWQAMRDGKSALVRVRGEKKRERARGANGGAEEQRSGVVLLIVSQSGREERGPDRVDIAREEHGDNGVSNTAPVPCRIAATGVMGDKGEQR